MERRVFLASTIAGLVVPFARLFADDPWVHDLKRSDLKIGQAYNGGNDLTWPVSITTWEMNLEENDHVHFDFVVTNSGPKQIRVVHCQPYALGTWQIITAFPPEGAVSGKRIKSNWRADNDSNAFFIMIQNENNKWLAMKGDSAASSDAHQDNGLTVAHMEWHQPQEVHFEVRAKRA